MLQPLLPAAISVLASLVWQSTAAHSAAEVAVVHGTQTTAIRPQTPEARSHNFRLALLVFSRDVLTIQGRTSAVRVKTKTPSFTVMPATAGAAHDIWLVRLSSKDGRRETKFDRDSANDLEDGALIPILVEPAGATNASPIHRVRPKSPLKSGEYAIVVGSRFYDFAVE
jgi:hypothetical protein